MEFKDYYATLGIGRHASADDVKAAFRKLARRYHPDVNPGDEAAERRFKEINEAHEVLGSPETRRKYDTLGANWKQYEQAQATGRNPFAGRGPFVGGWSFAGTGGFESAAFSDFFQTFFGPSSPGRRPFRRSAPTGHGHDVERPLDLTLEEAFAGVTRRLVTASGDRRSSVDVRIPPGVADGSLVRVAGRAVSDPGGRAGDVLLRVRIASHPRFTRRGCDLSMRCPIPLTTAVLGGEVGVSAIDGGTVRLKVPPGTQQGQVFRIRGRGMPSARPGGRRGDLYATVHVELPRSLTAEARRHFEALAALAEEDQADPPSPPPRANPPAA